MKPGEEKIWNAFGEDQTKELSYTEIKKITGLSPPALSKYLHGFLDMGLLLRDLETKKYYIPEGNQIQTIIDSLKWEHMPSEKFTNLHDFWAQWEEIDREQKYYMARDLIAGAELSNKKDLPEREELLYKILEGSKKNTLNYLERQINLIIRLFMEFENNPEHNWEDHKDDVLKHLKSNFDEFLLPLLHTHIQIMGANRDLAPAMFDRYTESLEQATPTAPTRL